MTKVEQRPSAYVATRRRRGQTFAEKIMIPSDAGGW